MDDSMLAEQYAKTGNLMDLCNTEAWFSELARLEDEGAVEAGPMMRAYSQSVSALTHDQIRQAKQLMKVQSFLFSPLRQTIESFNLGAKFDDAYALARRLVRCHLSNPDSNQQAAIDMILADDADSKDLLTEREPLEILSLFFTQEDRQAVEKLASCSMSANFG